MFGQINLEISTAFMKEAPKAWRDHLSFIETLNGTSHAVFTDRGEVYTDMTYETKSNAECRWTLIGDSKTKESVMIGYNRDYSFKLRRKADKQPWVLENVVLKSVKASALHVEALATRTYFRNIVSIEGESLASLVSRGTFKVTEAQKTGDNRNSVRISFTNLHPVNERPFCPIQRGTLVLDAKRAWCLISADVECKFGNGDQITTISTDISEGASSFPIPKRIVLHSVSNSSKNVTQDYVIHYSLSERQSQLPDWEFYLTAFGLPEPTEITPPRKPSSWFYWVGFATILCFVFTGLFAYLRNRMNPKQVSKAAN